MEMKRIVRSIVALILVFSLTLTSLSLPVGVVNAAEETTYVLAGGDFQEAGDHANSAENVTNILAQISQHYSTMDGFLFVGDYDCETHDDSTETAAGINALMTAVQGTYSNLNHDNTILVQGNHDTMDSNIDKTGGHEFDAYSVYVLNEDDYPNGGGSSTGVQALAEELETWLTKLVDEGYDKPIFITSHLPLAFSPRTVTQGDAKYAKYIFDVLNQASDDGLNIIFMHGHDHAYGPDNYLGGEAIYLPAGEKIAIAEAGSTSAYTNETLKFTYMNAGYTGYYSDAYTYNTTQGTEKLTMTVFAITDDEVTVERYSADGLYNLKSAGYDGSYSNTSVTNQTLGLGVNSTVYASPQTIALSASFTSEEATINKYVGITQEGTDDVSTSNNGWVEIVAPVKGTEATEGSTTYKYVLDTNGVNAGTKYLIVNTNSGTGYALTNNSGSVGRTSVSISNSEIIVSDDTNIAWTFSSSSSGNISNNGKYINLSRNSVSLGNSTNLAVSSQGSGKYTISKSSGKSSYYLKYSNNSWTSGNGSSNVYLYAYSETITTPGTEATEDVNGTYAKITGDLSYEAVGLTKKKALDLVKAGITAYTYEAMSTPGSSETGTEIDDSLLTWELDSSYDPNVPGDYAVTISYNGKVLGTAEVVVPESTTYYIAEGDGLYVVDMNTSSADALAYIKSQVTVYSASDDQGTDKAEANSDLVTYEFVDTYNPTSNGPYTVEVFYDGTSLGTVELKVDVHYDEYLDENWTYIKDVEASGGTHVYELDTNGIDAGEEHKYIIVARNSEYLLNAGSAVAIDISSDGTTVTTTTRDYEYYFTGSTSGLITRDGSNTLYQQNWGIHVGYVEDSNLDRFTNLGNGYYRIYDGDGTNRSLYYSDGWTVTSSDHTSSSYSVRLYKYKESVDQTPAGSIYAKLEGNTVYTVASGTTTSSALNTVKKGITGYYSYSADGSDPIELSDSELSFKWLNKYNGDEDGSYWVEISYEGIVLGIVEVVVEPGYVNNYPEYPDEGAVTVHKTGTGIDFQSSGIAKVEISASGVPVEKGADVIVMLDTSSSMEDWCICGTKNCSSMSSNTSTHKSREVVLEESLSNLIDQFQTPGDDGEVLDIKVAIADFNGFYSSGVYARASCDTMKDKISYSADANAEVYTGSKLLDYDAFIPATQLADSYDVVCASGTNYDYAFDAVYQLGEASRNSGEDRDLYVIFMSDGAAMQWNYYHSQGESDTWGEWITGTWSKDELADELACDDHSYYYNLDDTNGDGLLNEHRMANAIKGDQGDSFEVIRKGTTGFDCLYGQSEANDHLYEVPGLGATMFSIAFDPQDDTNVEKEYMTTSIETLASEQTGTTQYYYEVSSADELSSAFDSIGSEITYAASNARFVDQLGDNYSLQLSTSTYEVVEGETVIEKTLAPVIEILSYDIYTRQDWIDGNCEYTQIGDRKGTSSLLEVVKFSEDGTKAYSNLIDVDKDGNYGVTVNSDDTYTINDTDDNIFGDDGVIYAKTFVYNTNSYSVDLSSVSGLSIPTGTTSEGLTKGSTATVPAETFYWKLGTIQTSEIAMRYYVYLDGSMEGDREAGSYPTNNFAILYYDNYLGNPCYKETVSPVMAWKEANVSYAFYLVNENGEIIVNQTTGQTGSFANKVAVTNPVVYETILLNNLDTVRSIEVKSLGILPEGYELYDENSIYTVTINSNTTGSWDIDKTDGLVDSTYVMQYDPSNGSAYSNTALVGEDTDGNFVYTGYDYTHTVVWFAVLWKVQALPDTVVIDYGLPVDIHVLSNDMFGDYGKLAAVGNSSDSLTDITGGSSLVSGFGDTYTGTYGSATINKTSATVRYELNNDSDLTMDNYERFYYAVNYTGNENAGYYYDTVTVIPATTIYYEDNYVDFKYYDKSSGTAVEVEDGWVIEGSENTDATQAEDRPGQYSMSDANNIYGFDKVYEDCSTFSLGSARKATVNATSYATAEFDFTGTGFDIISMTSGDTGVFLMTVSGENYTKNYMVDTYYGYVEKFYKVTSTYTNGKWVDEELEITQDQMGTSGEKGTSPNEGDVCISYISRYEVDPTSTDALYQVPVLQVAGLDYGKYHVTLKATYSNGFNHRNDGSENSDNSYDLYVDGIRIYDPAGVLAGNENDVIEKAYLDDKEANAQFYEFRNELILENDLTVSAEAGYVFIDGNVSCDELAEYKAYGPNNEIYLSAGQSLSFKLNLADYADVLTDVQLGMKSADGNPLNVTVTNGVSTINKELNTSTDMYYSIMDLVSTSSSSESTDKSHVITITNNTNSTGVLSLTHVKLTCKDDTASTAQLFYADEEVAAVAFVRMTRMMETTFEPEVFEVITDEKVTVGKDIVVIVNTSCDVEYITVNNNYVTSYSEENNTRVFVYTIPTSETKEVSIEVCAYNANGTASEIIETTVTVEKSKKDKIKDKIKDFIKDLFKHFGKRGK